MQESDIPTKIIKLNVDIFTKYLFHEFEKSLGKSEYTSPFKFADITLFHKKGSRFEKNNYRPVSILPVLRFLCTTLLTCYDRKMA